MGSWTYEGLRYQRRPTRTVHVGDVAVGSPHPLRVQSMTTPSTQDTAATADQIERLVDAGCEIVRLTVPTNADADNLPNIRAELVRRKIRVPLVADIHFTPAAALRAVEYVDKVRINPGNYADKKKFAVREYSDSQYDAELERIERVFAPLVARAKELGVSMRIGTNHGSLSDRIMNRYGDTPQGMVESALEFGRICRRLGYDELIFSMKASNPVVVTHVYRLLAERMAAEGMDYPFHLGVTEAGDGEDGRVKSAVGIGSLLNEGIGDTVRVSLTEDPVAEIPVCRALVDRFNRWRDDPPLAPGGLTNAVEVTEPRSPFAYERQPGTPLTVGPHALGAGSPVRVEVPLIASLGDERALRAELDRQVGARVPEETRAEIVSVALQHAGQRDELERLRDAVELVASRVALSARAPLSLLSASIADGTVGRWLTASHRLHLLCDTAAGADPGEIAALAATAAEHERSLLVEAAASDGDAVTAVELAVAVANAAGAGAPLMLALTPRADTSPLHATRYLKARLAANGMETPLLLLDRPAVRDADPLLAPSASIGGLLCDGIGDAVHLDLGDADASRRLAFGVLQAARVRITRTEFISCPSCGRTLFDLEQTTARIKTRTAHLKGVKIAVMGCIVNGPGEMADADFGYVGWGEDKIALFVGKEMVAKDIPTADADARLVELIKEHGRWVDPPVPA